MAKIVGIDEEKVRIRTESGKEANVGISSLNFVPKIGDEIEVFRSNGKVVVSKKNRAENQAENLPKMPQKQKKKKTNAKLIIIGILIGIFMGAVFSNSSEDDEEDVENIVENTAEPSPYTEEYRQEQTHYSSNDLAFEKSTNNNAEETQGVTDVEVQNRNGVIDDFEYRIEGNTIYLIRYKGKDDRVELETSYIVDGVRYQSDISSFSAYGGYTKLIIHEGFSEVETPIFNSSDVREVFFPRSMVRVYDYTLAYMHNGDNKRNKIFYSGTQEEWLNIFAKYQRTKIEDAEFGEELGRAIGDKVNEWIGTEYDSSQFEYFFSASPDDLK